MAEKHVQWESKLVDGASLRSAEYLRINPGGYVPTLLHDGRIIVETRIICEYVDEVLPEHPLMPDDPYDRAKARRWTKEIDDSVHLNAFTLHCALVLRHVYAQMSREQREIMMPLDITRRERIHDILEYHERSRFVKMALDRFVRLIDDMERALSCDHWLAGDNYSLADVDYTPYLQRLAEQGLALLWRDRPAVADWFSRVKARPSFSAVLRDWVAPEDLERTAEAEPVRSTMFAGLLGVAQ